MQLGQNQKRVKVTQPNSTANQGQNHQSKLAQSINRINPDSKKKTPSPILVEDNEEDADVASDSVASEEVDEKEFRRKKLEDKMKLTGLDSDLSEVEAE